MSANLNLSLLKTLKGPIDSVLSHLIDSLQELSAQGGHKHGASGATPETVPGVKSTSTPALQSPAAVVDIAELRKVRDSFAMGGAYGLSKLLDYALQAGDLINTQAASKQDVLLLQATARQLSQLFAALRSHLDFLIKGESLETVLLWPHLYALCTAMQVDPPAPEFLFEPGFPLAPASAHSGAAAPVSKAAFKQAGLELRQTFQQLCDALGSCSDKSTVERTMKGLQDVLEKLRALRPRSNFQTYWLALRGSAAIAQMDTQNVLNQRQDWLHRFKDGLALSEIYLAGGHRFPEEKLYEALYPLLGEYPKSWVMLNPVIAETRQLFAIDQFKLAAIEAKNIELNQSLQEFNRQRPNLKKIMATLRQLWSSVLVGKATKQEFCNNVSILLNNREKLPTKDFLPLFNSLQALVDRFLHKPEEPIDPQLSDELASVILFFDEAIASSGHWNDRDRQQINLQKQRLDLALARRFAELAVLPKVEPNFIAHQLRSNATKDLVITQTHHELDRLRETLESIWQETGIQSTAALESLPSLAGKVQELSHVFAIFHKDYAQAAATALDAKISSLKNARNRTDPDLQASIQQLLGGLLAFLDHWKIDPDTAGESLLPLLAGTPGAQVPKVATPAITPITPTPAPAPVAPVSPAPPVSSPEPVPAAPPPVPAPVAIPAPPPVSLPDGVEPELVSSFLGEAKELLAQARLTNQALVASPDLLTTNPAEFTEHLTSLRRLFHTLKGSGKLVGLSALGNLASTYETVFDEVLASPTPWSATHATWLSSILDFFASWLDEIPADFSCHPDSSSLPSFPILAPSPVLPEPSVEDVSPDDALELDAIVGDLAEPEPSVPESAPVPPAAAPTIPDAFDFKPVIALLHDLGASGDPLTPSAIQTTLAPALKSLLASASDHPASDQPSSGQSASPPWFGLASRLSSACACPAPPAILPELCLILAVDLERASASLPVASRSALLSLLDAPSVPPAPASLDWEQLWQGLDTMGDGLQRLVEALGKATPDQSPSDH